MLFRSELRCIEDYGKAWGYPPPVPSASANNPFEELRQQFVKNVASMWQAKASELSGLLGTRSRKKHIMSYDKALEQFEHFVWFLMQDLENIYGKLATQRNSRIPINELPDDVLRIVFNFACEDTSQDSEDLEPFAVKLVQVCTRWGAVARDNAAMWSRIDMSIGEAKVKKFFKRSRGHEKVIIYGHDYWAPKAVPPPTLQLLGSHMNSVVELNITLADQSPFVTWLNKETTSVPVLHTLRLEHAASESRRDDRDKVPVLPSIADVVAKAPKLRSLILKGLRAPWKESSYRELTTLRISECYVGAHAFDEDILAALRGVPRLEELELTLACPFRWRPAQDTLLNTHPDGLSRVPLQSLRILRLSLPDPYLFHILRALDIPENLALLALTVNDYCDRQGTYDDTIPSQLFVPGILSSNILAGIKSVVLDCRTSEYRGVKFAGWRNHIDFEVRVYWENSRMEICEKVLDTIVKHHPLPSAQSFELSAHRDNVWSGGNTPKNLVTFMSALTCMTTMQITATPRDISTLLVKKTIHALSPKLATLKITTSSPEPLPDICRIWVPSLIKRIPGLKHFSFTVHAEPTTNYGSHANKMSKSNIAAFQAELQKLSSAHPSVDVRGYVYTWVREEDGDENYRPVQFWPRSEAARDYITDTKSGGGVSSRDEDEDEDSVISGKSLTSAEEEEGFSSEDTDSDDGFY